ncbi:MAG TPA: MaoC family dehydratase N-terminal domain-containing protein [Streptosporangiaceae bacterium]|jgi:acyl dehydratase
MTASRDDQLPAFPPAAPYDVSRVKIAEFADAIGDPDPLYRDPEAARAAGHPDVIAPPTFAVAVRAAEFGRRVFGPPAPDGLGIDPAHVFHIEEKYAHRRPLHAGDQVTVQVTVESARPMRDDEILMIRTDLRDTAPGAGAEPVSSVRTTLLVRGGRPSA